MDYNTGLVRYFNKQERQDFIKEMRKNGFEIEENNVPDMRKPNTSGYLSNKIISHEQVKN